MDEDGRYEMAFNEWLGKLLNRQPCSDQVDVNIICYNQKTEEIVIRYRNKTKKAGEMEWRKISISLPVACMLDQCMKAAKTSWAFPLMKQGEDRWIYALPRILEQFESNAKSCTPYNVKSRLDAAVLNYCEFNLACGFSLNQKETLYGIPLGNGD